MVIKIKRLTKEGVIPSYSKDGDAGMDLTATSKEYDKDGNCVYGTGLAFAIPEGHVGLLFPRSSNAKKDLTLSNSVGVLDSGYRGELFFKFKPSPFFSHTRPIDTNGLQYEVGDRIGQIIVLPYPTIEFEEVDELSETNRGEGGFGSTGS